MCDLATKTTLPNDTQLARWTVDASQWYVECEGKLYQTETPNAVAEYLGFNYDQMNNLQQLNDDGTSFEELADIIKDMEIGKTEASKGYYNIKPLEWKPSWTGKDFYETETTFAKMSVRRNIATLAWEYEVIFHEGLDWEEGEEKTLQDAKTVCVNIWVNRLTQCLEEYI